MVCVWGCFVDGLLGWFEDGLTRCCACVGDDVEVVCVGDDVGMIWGCFCMVFKCWWL